MAEESREFLPPQPAGPEPELGSAPPQAPPPPPTYGGWQPPQAAGTGYAQAAAPPYSPQAVQPDNGPAVAGFVLSVVSGSLLVISFGLSSIISVVCAVVGLVYSGKGKRKVESGQTTKNAGLANAGWIIAIVSLILSIIATIGYIVLVIALATDKELRDDFEREFDNSESIRAALQLGAAAGRLLLA
jgi:hypothetical protein